MAADIVQTTDLKLIDDAAEYISQLDRKVNVAFAYQLGSYLVGTFFGGNAAEAKSRDPGKQSSLRLLARHPSVIETGLSQSTLSNFIGLYLQLEALPSDKKETVERLGLSKQIALLSVATAEDKLQMAEDARTPGTTVRKLKEKIQRDKDTSRATAGKSKPGPKVQVVSATTRCLQVAERALAEAASGSEFVHEISEVLATVRKLLAKAEAPAVEAATAE